jgi:hypothetical protein
VLDMLDMIVVVDSLGRAVVEDMMDMELGVVV